MKKVVKNIKIKKEKGIKKEKKDIEENDAYKYKFNENEKETINILNNLKIEDFTTQQKINDSSFTIKDLLNIFENKKKENNKNTKIYKKNIKKYKKNKEKYKSEIKNEENKIEEIKIKNDDLIKQISACKTIINKIYGTKDRYDKNNNDKQSDENTNDNIVSSLIYFCKKDDVNNLLGGKNKIYNCDKYDLKLRDLKYNVANIIFNEIIKKPTKNKKDEYCVDISVKNYYDSIKEYENNNGNIYFIYHRKKIFSNELRNLLKNRKISFGKIINDILKNEFLNIIKIIDKKVIDENDNNELCENLYFIIKFIEEKINNQDKKKIDYKEEFVKSHGELITTLFLLLYFGSSFNLNTKPLINNVSNRPLEMDFYFDDYNLAIEIDGGHHKEKDQEKRDIIKKFLCDDQNVKLIRIDTDKKPDNEIISMLYKNIEEFTKSAKISINENINEKIILDIVTLFQKIYKPVKKMCIYPSKKQNLNKKDILKKIDEINDNDIKDISNIYENYIINSKIGKYVDDFYDNVDKENKLFNDKLNEKEKNDIECIKKTEEIKSKK